MHTAKGPPRSKSSMLRASSCSLTAHHSSACFLRRGHSGQYALPQSSHGRTVPSHCAGNNQSTEHGHITMETLQWKTQPKNTVRRLPRRQKEITKSNQKQQLQKKTFLKKKKGVGRGTAKKQTTDPTKCQAQVMPHTGRDPCTQNVSGCD